MVACVQVPVRKFPERLPTACLYLIYLLFIPLCVHWGLSLAHHRKRYSFFVPLCVHWGLSLAHHRNTIDFDPGDVCGGPLFCNPSTFARVQNRFGFVDLGGDMCFSCTGEVQGGTEISGWYQLVLSGWYQHVLRTILVVGDNEARPQYLQ